MVSERKHSELAKFADEISRCGRCGFCQSVCPVYQARAHEEGVARGRNMYARELLAGTLDASKANEAFFTECLLCRACVEMCFSSVKTDDIVLAMRRDSVLGRGRASLHRYIFNHLLPDHRRLGRALRFASLGRTAGALRLAQALDVFGWYGDRFKKADGLLAQLPGVFLRDRPGMRTATTPKSKKAFYFVGCGMNFMFPDAGEATMRILEALDYEVIIRDNGCCGLPAYAHGDRDSALRLVLQNIDLFSGSDDVIVTDCSSCASFLKEYPDILKRAGIDDASISKAEGFAARVQDMTEVLAERTATFAEQKAHAKSLRVTFHDPCHLSRHQKLSTQARSVLRALPNVEFVEMREADWCCGGAGAFAFEHPDLSLKVLERKMRNIEQSGADIVTTTCPSCMMQLRSGQTDSAGQTERRAQIVHLTELVRQSCLE